MASIIGWDIGGAHLKAARLENGHIVNVVQIASPLWQGIGELHYALDQARELLGPADRHAATMTAELADAFADRTEGVTKVAEIAEAALGTENLRFYAGHAGLVRPDAVATQTEAIASANWHASAALVARHFSDAIFADMGSTTTDLIPVRDGKVAAFGNSDVT
ncbi:MAG TPA: hydantoinase/oxoprolinase family protein, partial [Methylovirgula sp.]|nr:hydantoinase/oxoprolinase family protein [Methylovirgula sp.]